MTQPPNNSRGRFLKLLHNDVCPSCRVVIPEWFYSTDPNHPLPPVQSRKAIEAVKFKGDLPAWMGDRGPLLVSALCDGCGAMVRGDVHPIRDHGAAPEESTRMHFSEIANVRLA